MWDFKVAGTREGITAFSDGHQMQGQFGATCGCITSKADKLHLVSGQKLPENFPQTAIDRRPMLGVGSRGGVVAAVIG